MGVEETRTDGARSRRRIDPAILNSLAENQFTLLRAEQRPSDLVQVGQCPRF